MSNRKKVMSAEAMLDRRHLLACNLDKVVDAMKGSGLADPVGFVVDSTDLQGRQFAIHMRRAAGAPADEATRQTDQANTEYLRNRMTPTLLHTTFLKT